MVTLTTFEKETLEKLLAALALAQAETKLVEAVENLRSAIIHDSLLSPSSFNRLTKMTDNLQAALAPAETKLVDSHDIIKMERGVQLEAAQPQGGVVCRFYTRLWEQDTYQDYCNNYAGGHCEYFGNVAKCKAALEAEKARG